MTTLSFDVTVSTEDSQDTATVFQEFVDDVDISDTNFESIISQDWDDIALDDGLVYEEYGSYYARIFPRPGASSGSILESRVENIQFSPEINAAVPLTIDVEPNDAIKSQDYLSGIIDVFVNGEPLFSGEIVKITTLEKDDDFYTIKAKPPGQKLNEESIELTTDNYIVSDFVAKTVDRFNSYDDEHFELVNTDSEIVGSGVSVDGKRVRRSTQDGSELRYTDVGPSASEIDKIYFKLGAELSSYNVTATIETSNSSYSESYTDIAEGAFGEWVELVPDDSLNGEPYDIVFTMDSGTFVYDWISITDQTLQRDVEVEGGSTEQNFSDDSEVAQEASSSSQFETITSNNLTDTLPIDISFGSIDFLQTAYYGTDIDELLFDGPIFFESFANYSANRRSDAGEGYAPENEGDEVAFSFSLDYTMPAGEWGVMMRYGDPNEDLKVREAVIEVDGQEVESFVDGFGTVDGLSWLTTVGSQTDFDLEEGGHRVTFRIISEGEDDASTYDALPIDILGVYDQRFNYTFDNEVDDNYNLEGPEKYPLQESEASALEINQIASPEVIGEAGIDVSCNDPNGIKELGLSFDGGLNFFSDSNTESIRFENPESTASIIGRLSFSGFSPNGEQQQTPKFGYEGQSVSSYELSILTLDVELLFQRDVSGNRLSVISDICDEFGTSFRWEGNNCRILTGEADITDVDLRKEQVESVVDIEDVYASARVIGKDVDSGVIEADNAPDYVSRTKQINDPSVTTEQDAKRKATAFLEENSQIYFEANISTLPTRAPIGQALPGNIFSHGKDSVIRRVRYSKRNTTILCDREKDLRKEILDLDRNVESTNRRDTL